jgi:hypothetical protein
LTERFVNQFPKLLSSLTWIHPMMGRKGHINLSKDRSGGWKQFAASTAHDWVNRRVAPLDFRFSGHCFEVLFSLSGD